MGGFSQKRDPQNSVDYIPGKYIVSFVAFVPADDPQVALLLVLLDEPVSGQLDSIAASLAGRIMTEILPYLQIASH